MKKTFLLFAFLWACIGPMLNAQVSKGWQYQAVVRDGNQIKAMTAFDAQFTILKNSPTGSIAYIETHSDTTNEFGLVSLPLGHGLVAQGQFDTINWLAGRYFLKVEMDLGSGVQEFGTEEILFPPQLGNLVEGGKFVGIAPIFGFDEGAANINSNNWQVVTRTQYSSMEAMFPQPIAPGTVRHYYAYIRKADNINECAEWTEWRFWFDWSGVDKPGYEFKVNRDWGTLQEGNYRIVEILPTSNQIQPVSWGSGYWRLEARIPSGCTNKDMRVFGISIMAVDLSATDSPPPSLDLNTDTSPGILPRYSLGGPNGGIIYNPDGYLNLKGSLHIDLQAYSGSHGRDGLIINASNDNTDGVIIVNKSGLSVWSSSDNNFANFKCRTLTITGGDGAEAHHIAKGYHIEPGMVVVLDENEQGKIRTTTKAYDKKAAGVISGMGEYFAGVCFLEAELKKGALPLALIGTVEVYAVGPIEVGDLLTTSETPGYVMAASDLLRSIGTTVGKAKTSLKAGEKGMVVMLVEKH